MKYGRLKNNMVVDISKNPTIEFHPEIAAEFIEIPDAVAVGFVFDGTNYNAPEPPTEHDSEQEPKRVESLKITPVEFKLLFLLTERVKIAELRENDAVLRDFYSMLDDPRLTVVDLSKRTIIDAVRYTFDALVNAGAVSDEDEEKRIGEVLGGQDVDA